MKIISVTIKDVAKMAGVSVATVSRAMNKSAKVSSVKKKKIDQAIKKLNYQPNIIAQNMVSKRLNNVGLVLSHAPDHILQSPYISRMFVGFAKGFSKLNFETLLVLAENQEQEIEKCMQLYNYGATKGFILMGARVNDNTISTLYNANIPFVVIGHPNPRGEIASSQINSVDTDSISDTKSVTQHLIEKGHKTIAFMHSPLNYMVNKERFEGYALGLTSSGIKIDENLIFEVGYSIDDVFETSQKILNLNPLPTAVITTDDVKAVAFIKCAIEAGLRVPEDISVIGHNNYSQSKISIPSLTTVNVPIEDLGMVSANLFTQILTNPEQKPQRIILPTETIYRNSVINVK